MHSRYYRPRYNPPLSTLRTLGDYRSRYRFPLRSFFRSLALSQPKSTQLLSKDLEQNYFSCYNHSSFPDSNHPKPLYPWSLLYLPLDRELDERRRDTYFYKSLHKCTPCANCSLLPDWFRCIRLLKILL